MELMREYKSLKALQQAGTLSPTDEARLREVAAFLQGAMANRKDGGDSPAAASSAPKPAPTKAAAPAAPAAAPAKAAAAAPAAKPAPAKPAAPSKPLWQIQKEEEEARQKRAQALFQVAVPDEVAGYEPPSTPNDGPKENFIPEDELKAGAPDVDIDNDPRFKPPPKPKRVRNEEDLRDQLQKVRSESLYSADFDELQAEFYYSYLGEGYSLIQQEPEQVALEPVDPREIELRRAGLVSDSGAPNQGVASMTAIPGGVFLDDFVVLYEKGVLPRPEDDEEPEVEDPNALVPGKRKVALHMLSGEVKRGSIVKIMRGDPGFQFVPERGKAIEIPFEQIKALFIMRGKNPPTLDPFARKVTVEFKDRRRIQGVSSDYQPGQVLFTMIPQGPGNFELVIVNAAAAARIG